MQNSERAIEKLKPTSTKKRLDSIENRGLIIVPLVPVVCLKLFVNNIFIGYFRALCDSGAEQNLIRVRALKNI